MTALGRIAALLWREGVAKDALGPSLAFVAGFEDENDLQSGEDEDLVEAVIRPLVEAQTVSSPESFRWALQVAVAEAIWSVDFVCSLALARDGREWVW